MPLKIVDEVQYDIFKATLSGCANKSESAEWIILNATIIANAAMKRLEECGIVAQTDTHDQASSADLDDVSRRSAIAQQQPQRREYASAAELVKEDAVRDVLDMQGAG